MSGVSDKGFREVLGRFATGVTVMAIRGPDGAPVGVTVNAFSSLSLDPPLILFCLDRAADSHKLFHVSAPFAVNILGEDQSALSTGFAEPGPGPWGSITWRGGPNDEPVIDGCVGWLGCLCEQHLPGGDHDIIVGRVLATDWRDDARPLIYYRGGYHRMGEAIG